MPMPMSSITILILLHAYLSPPLTNFAVPWAGLHSNPGQSGAAERGAAGGTFPRRLPGTSRASRASRADDPHY